MQEIWDGVNAKIAHGKSNIGNRKIAYMMINHCPSICFSAYQCNRSGHAPDSAYTDIAEHLPVTGAEKKTYRNEYYAQHHRITNITLWSITVLCSDLLEGTNLT